MQNVPKRICSHSADNLLIGNQMKPRPVRPGFDNNKEADGPATKGDGNVCVVGANEAIRKLEQVFEHCFLTVRSFSQEI